MNCGHIKSLKSGSSPKRATVIRQYGVSRTNSRGSSRSLLCRRMEWFEQACHMFEGIAIFVSAHAPGFDRQDSRGKADFSINGYERSYKPRLQDLIVQFRRQCHPHVPKIDCGPGSVHGDVTVGVRNLDEPQSETPGLQPDVFSRQEGDHSQRRQKC